MFLFIRLDFEADVNILKKTNDERQKQFEIQRDRLHEQIKSLEKSRDEFIKDNTQLNTKIKHINDCQNELEREKEKNRELYKKCIQYESQLSSTNGIEVNSSTCFFLFHFLLFSARINGNKFEIKT